MPASSSPVANFCPIDGPRSPSLIQITANTGASTTIENGLTDWKNSGEIFHPEQVQLRPAGGERGQRGRGLLEQHEEQHRRDEQRDVRTHPLPFDRRDQRAPQQHHEVRDRRQEAHVRDRVHDRPRRRCRRTARPTTRTRPRAAPGRGRDLDHRRPGPRRSVGSAGCRRAPRRVRRPSSVRDQRQRHTDRGRRDATWNPNSRRRNPTTNGADERPDVDPHVEDRERRVPPRIACRRTASDHRRHVRLEQPGAEGNERDPAYAGAVEGSPRHRWPATITVPPYRTVRRAPNTRSANQPPSTDSR